MANEWRTALLGDLTVNHDGKRKPVKESDRRPGPYPYYGASGIVDYVDGYLFDGDYLLIAEDGENLRTRQTPVAFMARGKSWVNNHAHIVTGNDKADTRFLMYAIEGLDISGYLTGAVMPKLTQGNLNKIELECPPLKEQRAIAYILGTLDDKIELNRKQNETLEAMARALFKAWFVDFEPVRAKMEGRWQRNSPLPPGEGLGVRGLPAHLYDLFPDRLVDSELGGIPEGWEVASVDVEFDVTMGQSPPGNTYNEIGEGLPFYQGRSDFEFRFPKRRVYCTAPTRLAKNGDTLVSVRAPVGDINMASEDCAIGRGVGAVRHKTGCRSYTYQFMSSISDVFARFDAEGTVFGSIGKKDFHSISHVKPPRDLVLAYEKLVAQPDDQIERSERESRSLAQLRDTLLPKLISGELRVPDAEAFLKARGL
ncbi:MAG: restriction endonuclease subunit S [Thermomonas sp.]|uniref:restriction endonuclease subunit S n=1 Tax=Thermomonas sp. TaxID=1971895 RepID=UPI001DEB78F7|nr:restriction endonuclease subunit S [Thermomonas sp.]MBZ0086902.1 restriction endonuclease subunit S [Thermomonas sp.]